MKIEIHDHITTMYGHIKNESGDGPGATEDVEHVGRPEGSSGMRELMFRVVFEVKTART